ncbi:MAG: hypothetical protein PHW10_01650 [Candidatus Peribacteraceae bacterium]|nr:hypothetical protein [Candidatus Peribacteraceae bacterium]
MSYAKKKSAKKLDRDYAAQLFLVLGIFAAALTTEGMNIVHEWAKSIGETGYWAYSIVIVFVLWPYFMIQIVNILDEVYLKRLKK